MHTPGPWNCERLIDQKGSPYATHYQAHIDIGVCMVWAPPGNAEQEANARLIAAAPEMLEALQSAMRIKDLWLPIGDVSDEHAEELKALSLMAMKFESVIKKATVTDADQTSAIGETQ